MNGVRGIVYSALLFSGLEIVMSLLYGVLYLLLLQIALLQTWGK